MASASRDGHSGGDTCSECAVRITATFIRVLVTVIQTTAAQETTLREPIIPRYTANAANTGGEKKDERSREPKSNVPQLKCNELYALRQARKQKE